MSNKYVSILIGLFFVVIALVLLMAARMNTREAYLYGIAIACFCIATMSLAHPLRQHHS